MTGQPAFNPGDAVLVFYRDTQARGLYPGGFPGRVRQAHRKYGSVDFTMPHSSQDGLVRAHSRSIGFELATGRQHPYHEGISEGLIVVRDD